MNLYKSDLIEYQNINDCTPIDIHSFKQINIDARLCIPNHKPNIEQILKISSHAIINNFRVIKTPKGTSLEGVVLTGYKVVIEGTIEQKVQYIADIEVQSIHTAHFQIPFLTFVVLPDGFNPNSSIVSSAFIEDICAYKEDCRCFYVNNTLLITAEFC